MSQYLQTEVKSLSDELTQVKESYTQSQQRVEELVLGLGKESALIATQYESQISDYELEKEQLLKEATKLRTEVSSTVTVVSTSSSTVSEGRARLSKM